MKRKFVCMASLFIFALCGCSKQNGDADNPTTLPNDIPAQLETHDTENKPEPHVMLDAKASDPAEKEIITPTRD